MANFSLADAIAGVASRHPEREAIATHDASHSYGDLLRIASQCARHLEAHGVGPGDRVAIAVRRADDSIFAVLACWMLGATCMVIDFRARTPEKRLLASAFALKAVVEARPSSDGPDYLSVPVGERLADTVAAHAGDMRVRPAEIHPAIVIRTSGTTGDPVGVVFSHETMMRYHWTITQDYLGFDRGLSVHALPMFYAFGFVNTLSQLLDGSTTHVLPAIASAEEIAEKVLASGARNLAIIPPQMSGLLELSAGRTTPLFPDLAALIASGGRFTADNVLRAYTELSANLRVPYGASFGGSISVLSGPDIPARPHTVGRPQPHTHLRIADFDGNPLPRGETGLICVRSPSIADAVIGEPRALSDKMIDGWAVPGDLGFIDEEGFVTLTGRATDMIIRKGVNVYPREIESVLEARDDVVEAAVLGYLHDGEEEEIAAFVVARPGITVEMLRAHLQSRLVADKRPRIVRIVEALPRNDAGKVLKRVLAESLETGEG